MIYRKISSEGCFQILNTVKRYVVENKKFKAVSNTPPLYRLDPSGDDCGVLYIGDHVQNGVFAFYIKHLIILPRKCHFTQFIIRYLHECTRYQGRSITNNAIRSNRYWTIGCGSAVYSFICRCVKCRKYRSQTQNQKMSDLPAERLLTSAPSPYNGVTFF